MRQLVQIALLLSMTFPVAAQTRDAAAEDLVRRYVQARSQTMQEHAGSDDIERALSFCKESFVYEHPAAGARIEGKEKARAGMSGYLGETKDDSYTLQIFTSNPRVVVARVNQKFLVKQEDGSWVAGKRSNITVFEIDSGKIARILDY
jgi:hypothetical protein